MILSKRSVGESSDNIRKFESREASNRAKIIRTNIQVKRRSNIEGVLDSIKSLKNSQTEKLPSKTGSTSTIKNVKTKIKQKAKKLIDWNNEKPRKNEPYQNKNVEKPYAKAPNEINFLGGLGSTTGNLRSKIFIERPTAVQKIYNMRTRNAPIFTFSEDPREANSCFKKQEKIDIGNLIKIKRKAKVEDIIEVFDYDNPLAMDFQGFDYKETYQKDEQTEENKIEYNKQKTYVDKLLFERTVTEELDAEQRQVKFGLPKIYDINEKVAVAPKDDIFLEDPIIPEWTDKFRIPLAIEDPEVKRPHPGGVPFVPESKIQAELIRTADKPKNTQKTNNIFNTRRNRITYRLKERYKKLDAQDREKMRIKQIEDENFNANLAEHEFNEFFTDKHQKVLLKYQNLDPVYKEKSYPHTMRELRYYKKLQNRKKRIIKENAKIKSKFWSDIGKPKYYKEQDIVIDERASYENAEEISEQSTDDEDGLTIGPVTSEIYELRGFHAKLNREPRGKLDVKLKEKSQRAPRTCLTRAEWFDILVPKTKPPVTFKNCPSTLISKAEPTDDYYSIIEQPKFIPRPCNVSAIHEMINNPPPSPRVVNPQKPKVQKPERIKIKKFNLTGYMFGTTKREKREAKKSRITGLNKSGISYELIARSDALYDANIKKIKADEKKRLKAIGVDVGDETEEKPANIEASSDSSNEDWIPDQEQKEIQAELGSKSSLPISISTYSITNMQAPKFREPTIRQHPRRKRRKLNSSVFFTENVPRLLKLPNDSVIHSNLETRKTKYTDIFNIRHHHDHFDRTQHKNIWVKYNPKIPIADNDQQAEEKLIKKSDVLPIQANEIQVATSEDQHTLPRRTEHDKFNRSKEKYNNFIQTKFLIYHKTDEQDFEEETREELLNALKNEVESINSCYSSDSSSVVTNFSRDSGSFMNIQGTKVPMDYIIKNKVPFDQFDRSRVKAVDFSLMDEYYSPYFTTPFCGQQQVMRKITMPKDQFYTSSVRSRYGIRNRLQVTLTPFSHEIIGTKGNKHMSCLATEWDDFYQQELKNRPRIKIFQASKILPQSRNALRKKFVALFIKKSITEYKIRETTLENYFTDFEKFREVCDKLFKQWKESYYRRSMRKLQELEPEYEITRNLQNVLVEQRKISTKLNMKIIYLEDDWIRRIIYQNFHYFVADKKWRIIHDWIHRDENGLMENFRQSIENRFIKNIRVRDKDDAWAVKNYYDKIYLENYHEPLHPLKTSDEFRKGVLKLKLGSFMSLVDLHFKMWILVNVTKGYNEFVTWSTEYLGRREKYVKDRCQRKYFMQDRAIDLEKNGKHLIQHKLTESMKNPLIRTIVPMCENLYEDLISAEVRDALTLNFTIIDKFGMISNLVMDTLGEIDKLPIKIYKKAEIDVRKKHSYTMRQSERACALEQRINFVMDGIKRNLEPPYVKPKRIGKLPRSYLPKRKPKPPPPKPPVPYDIKLFYKAFTDDTVTDEIDINNAENMQILKSLQFNCIPFYFDHFLKLHDYIPAYDFKTKIELRDGPEEAKFVFKDVLPEVFDTLQKWTTYKKIEMEHFIEKGWYLYRDF